MKKWIGRIIRIVLAIVIFSSLLGLALFFGKKPAEGKSIKGGTECLRPVITNIEAIPEGSIAVPGGLIKVSGEHFLDLSACTPYFHQLLMARQMYLYDGTPYWIGVGMIQLEPNKYLVSWTDTEIVAQIPPQFIPGLYGFSLSHCGPRSDPFPYYEFRIGGKTFFPIITK